MQYVTCPICGAHLDPGERCDCEEHKKEEPLHANEPGSSTASQLPISIISHIGTEHKTFLKDIRSNGGISAKEIANLVRTQYPGYDKMLQSKCENPAKYGVWLVPEALALVIEKFLPSAVQAFECRPSSEEVVFS